MIIDSFTFSQRTQRGFVLLETLLSVGLIAIILSTIGGVVLISGGNGRAAQASRAEWAVHEGLSALESMSFSDLALTSVGSLSFSGNKWVLGSSAPQTIATGITRTVQVKQVNRNASCQIVSSGGTADSDSKTIESDVNWIDLAGRTHSIALSSLKTQWGNPQGSCFKTQAGCSHIDYQTSGQWSGGKQLRSVYFTNTCAGTTPVIDKIVMTWSNSAHIQQSFISSTKVWSSSGPGTPSGSQSSGTTLDIQNFSLSSGVQYEFNKTQFDSPMSETTVTITLIFTDGTSLATPPFVPSG